MAIVSVDEALSIPEFVLHFQSSLEELSSTVRLSSEDAREHLGPEWFL